MFDRINKVYFILFGYLFKLFAIDDYCFIIGPYIGFKKKEDNFRVLCQPYFGI